MVSIYEAKTQLSRLVKRAKAGETIHLGAYGRAEAILAPVPRARPPFRLGVMAHLHDPAFDSDSLSRRRLAEAESVHVSVATFWELGIKHRKGTFPVSPSVLVAAAESSYAEELPVLRRHVLTVDQVELRHRDPFDALLVAQALCDGFQFLTSDESILESFSGAADARR